MTTKFFHITAATNAECVNPVRDHKFKITKMHYQKNGAGDNYIIIETDYATVLLEDQQWFADRVQQVLADAGIRGNLTFCDMRYDYPQAMHFQFDAEFEYYIQTLEDDYDDLSVETLERILNVKATDDIE